MGCPRSGTTLLQSLLSAHPEIVSFPESKFFQYLPPAERSRRRRLGVISHQLKPWLETYFTQNLKRPEMLCYLPKLPCMRLYTRQFFKILWMLAAEQGKNIVLEKTPQHIFYIKLLINYFPDSKIIHLIRKGEDVVASLYEVTHQYPQYWEGVWELDKCVDWWNRSVQISQQYGNHPNHILVSYEQLLQNPKNFLTKICNFLNLKYHSEMIEHYGKTSQSLIFNQAGRTVKSDQIKRSNSQKFYEVLTEKQQNYVLSHLEKLEINF
jgi:hypothetical protein